MAKIEGGVLVENEVDLYDKDTFRLWTFQVQMARNKAKRFGLKCKVLSGEAELYFPVDKAHKVLKGFEEVGKTSNKLLALKLNRCDF